MAIPVVRNILEANDALAGQLRERFAAQRILVLNLISSPGAGKTTAIYQRLLDRMDADGYRVMNRRYRLPAWRKLWVAWRTARQEARRARKAGK